MRAIANGLEWSYGWGAPAAQRLRFLLDFGYATGLRISELTQAALRNVEVDAAGDHWLHVVGKGGKPAKVTLTPLARVALDRYLQERGLPISRARWDPATPLVGSLDGSEIGITALRLWEIMRRFFRLAADSLASDHPPLAEKLRLATPQKEGFIAVECVKPRRPDGHGRHPPGVGVAQTLGRSLLHQASSNGVRGVP